jgi:hypothetical protein
VPLSGNCCRDAGSCDYSSIVGAVFDNFGEIHQSLFQANPVPPSLAEIRNSGPRTWRKTIQ